MRLFAGFHALCGDLEAFVDFGLIIVCEKMSLTGFIEQFREADDLPKPPLLCNFFPGTDFLAPGTELVPSRLAPEASVEFGRLAYPEDGTPIFLISASFDSLVRRFKRRLSSRC